MSAISDKTLEAITQQFMAWKRLAKAPDLLAGVRGRFKYTVAELALHMKKHLEESKVSMSS